MKDPNKYPSGWDAHRVKKLLQYYENQSDDEAVEEDETAFSSSDETVMVIPNELVPAVRALISKQ